MNDIKTIAFCCISTGVFAFSQNSTAEIAVRMVADFLEHDEAITQLVFNVFTDTDFAIYDKLLNNLR